MTNFITQAKEIQQLAGKFLCEEVSQPYTDIEEWKGVQEHLATCIEELLKQQGTTPDEEGEIALAILMGYNVAVRKRKHIAQAMERANRVLNEIQNPVLQCKLAIFCFGECYDENLKNMAYGLIDKQKTEGYEEMACNMEALLLSIEEKVTV